jgi:hypothetical protein
MAAESSGALKRVVRVLGMAAWLLLALVLTAVLFMAVLWAISNDAAQPDVSVSFSGYTNTGDGHFRAVLTLSNQGPQSLRRQRFCTTYWTNAAGEPLYDILSLSPPSSVIRSGDAETVTVAPPADPAAWRPDFGFTVEPDLFHRAMSRIIAANPWRQTNAGKSGPPELSVFPGPAIQPAPGLGPVPAAKP